MHCNGLTAKTKPSLTEPSQLNCTNVFEVTIMLMGGGHNKEQMGDCSPAACISVSL